MRQSIWKFPLQIEDRQTVLLPAGSKVLSVAEQNGGIVLYAMVQQEIQGQEKLIVYMYGTGHPIDTDDHERWSSRNRFVGTVKLASGSLMFHVFVEE